MIIRPIRPHPTDPTAALVELTRGHWSVIDAADADIVRGFNWHADMRPGRPTSYAAGYPNGRSRTYLHKFIGKAMGISGEIDHKNGNGLDNRRSNLRPATSRENARNHRLRVDNTSGVKGVWWDKRARKWKSAIELVENGKRRRIHVGSFDDISDAAARVAEARIALHGDFANHGVPFTSEEIN